MKPVKDQRNARLTVNLTHMQMSKATVVVLQSEAPAHVFGQSLEPPNKALLGRFHVIVDAAHMQYDDGLKPQAHAIKELCELLQEQRRLVRLLLVYGVQDHATVRVEGQAEISLSRKLPECAELARTRVNLAKESRAVGWTVTVGDMGDQPGMHAVHKDLVGRQVPQRIVEARQSEAEVRIVSGRARIIGGEIVSEHANRKAQARWSLLGRAF